MKSTFRIIAVFSVLALMSCNKDLNVKNGTTRVITAFPTTVVESEVDPPVVESNPSTKIYGYVADPENAPGKHTVKWKAGDQISQFCVVYDKGTVEGLNIGDVINFSNLRSTLKNGDGTKTFSMEIADLKTMYGANSGVATYLCAIYPATTFSDITTTIDGAKINVTATPASLNIPAEQDGTGWKYSIFIARSATFSAQWNNPIGGTGNLGSTFHMMSTLLRLKLNTTKDITKVVLTSSTGFLSGDVTSITMNSFHYATDVPKNFSLAAGCPGKTVTVENGGEALPDDLFFAIREIRYGTDFTLTFTASDGTTQTKSFTNPAGWDNLKRRGVFSLGTITLAADDWI